MTLTKSYAFSASYSSGPRVVSHNYRLEAVFDGVLESQEPALDRKIQDGLIRKIHSQDLGQHVDFLRGKALSETVLLEAFWNFVSELVRPASLKALSIERDGRTRWTLTGPR